MCPTFRGRAANAIARTLPRFRVVFVGGALCRASESFGGRQPTNSKNIVNMQMMRNVCVREL